MSIRDDERHILVLGDPNGLPIALWQIGKRVVTSLIGTERELLGQIPVDHVAMVTIDANAGVNDWLRTAEELHRRRPVTAVVSPGDRCIPYAAMLNEHFGISGGHGAHAAKTADDKWLWRHRMNEAGVEYVAQERVYQANGIREFGERHGWPVIVKPCRQAGSHGLTKLPGPDQAESAFDWAKTHLLSSGDDVLVEEYLDGEHYNASTLSEGGEHLVIALTRIVHAAPHMTEVYTETPANISPMVRRTITEHVTRALDAVGAVSGPGSVEVRLTTAGPRTVECQLRLEGDDVWQQIDSVIGVDLPELWARQLVGKPALAKARKHVAELPVEQRFSVKWAIYAPADGVIRAIEGLEEARAVPSVVEVGTAAQPGDVATTAKNALSRVVYVLCEDIHADTARQQAQLAADMIAIVMDE